MIRFLWVCGKVMVAKRRGVEKWWDLAERVIPAEARAGALREAEAVRRAAELSVRGLGVATAQHIKGHFTVGRYPGLPRILERLEREGVIERVAVASDGTTMPGTWFVHRDDRSLLERIERGRWEPRSTLLSPFDNLIHDRARSELLFDLNYRMEIYVPKAKRRFGYYAMPLLHGDRFVARVDPAVDRASGRLTLNAAAVRELAAWTGSDGIELAGPAPDAWRRYLG
jgi:hypothetical protein